MSKWKWQKRPILVEAVWIVGAVYVLAYRLTVGHFPAAWLWVFLGFLAGAVLLENTSRILAELRSTKEQTEQAAAELKTSIDELKQRLAAIEESLKAVEGDSVSR